MGLFGRSMNAFYIFISFASSTALADSVSYGIHHQYQSVRALGMGDAFTAVTNDYSAMFYNPAALARREDGEVNLALDFAATAAIFNFADDISKAQKTTGTDSQKESAILTVLANQYGKSFGGRGGVEGIWARPNWSFAIRPLDLSLELTPHQAVGPSVATTVIADTTVAYAYASDYKGLEHGRLSWGVTGKFINRGYFSKMISALELAADSNFVKSSDLSEGYTVDADIGFLYTPEFPDSGWFKPLKVVRPTFSAVIRNAFETGFSSSMNLLGTKATTRPDKDSRVIDLGSKWEFPSLWIFAGRGAVDFRDILHPNVNLKKSFHAGLEFDWTVSSWWRGSYRVGLNQGYFTAGLSAMFTILNLDLVTYGEEVGTYGTNLENRVYALKASMNF